MRTLGWVIVGFELGTAYDDFLFTSGNIIYFGKPREICMLFFAAMVAAALWASRKSA